MLLYYCIIALMAYKHIEDNTLTMEHVNEYFKNRNEDIKISILGSKICYTDIHYPIHCWPVYVLNQDESISDIFRNKNPEVDYTYNNFLQNCQEWFCISYLSSCENI
jgi:hypothetical protein